MKLKDYLLPAVMAAVMVGLALLMIASAQASDPPDNRPPENRPPEHNTPPIEQTITVDVPVDVAVPVDVNVDVPVDVLVEGSPVTVDVPVDARSTNITDLDFEDSRQAPAIGLSTPADSTGFGITTPLFGFMLNLPWTFGDREIMPVCDRLVGQPDAWRPCICLTSVMKKLHGKDSEACVKSLGGGSSTVPKPSEDDIGTITGLAFGYSDGALDVAQVDPEVEELRVLVGDLMAKVADLEAGQEREKEREQVQQQQAQQRRVEKIDYDAVRRANTRETLKQLELLDEEKPK